MGKLEHLGTVIETDVLVIGGGPSGLWAANRAREFVKRVTIVDKGPRDWGGTGSMASGGYIAVLRDENVDDFVRDVIYFYDGLCDPFFIEEVLRQSIYRLEDYQKLGVEFFKREDGKLWGLIEHGLEHLTLYTAMPFPHGGKIMVQALLNQADKLGVKRYHRTLLTDLVKCGDRIAGAIGFNTLSGEFYIFKANAVVLATNGCGWKPNFGKNTVTGEGIAMALRAGAEVSNYEFAGTLIAPKKFAWEGLSNLVPLGGKFINAKGESFMENYSPFGSNTDDTFIFMAMIQEARVGRGPFYMDCRPIKPKDRVLVTPTHGWMDLNYRKLQKIGMDLLNQKVEWVPMVTAIRGAVHTDMFGNTSVPGLFACGRARNFDPTTYLNGSSLCMTAVTGHITGETVGKYVLSHKPCEMDKDQVEILKHNLYASLGKDGISPKEVIREVQEAVFPADVCLLKNEVSLKKAIARLESIKNELLPSMGAKDSHYLLKNMEARAITISSELFVRASLMRTESRAGHYREDYPNRDDDNGLSWIVIKQDGDDFVLRREPIPYDRYKFRPTRFYTSNFNFPK
jgi:succinate dehydrogenase/fumarate reductase flavoprotein subunit